MAAIARRDHATAASLVPDDAVEAFAIAGSSGALPAGGCATSSKPGSTSPC